MILKKSLYHLDMVKAVTEEKIFWEKPENILLKPKISEF